MRGVRRVCTTRGQERNEMAVGDAATACGPGSAPLPPTAAVGQSPWQSGRRGRQGVSPQARAGHCGVPVDCERLAAFGTATSSTSHE